jgi:uncharacterized protein (TIGR01244 family)
MKNSIVAVSIALSVCFGTTSMSQTQVPSVAAAVSPIPGVVSAGRLKPEDIAQLKRAGIEHVIDLTPDDETPDFDEANAVRSAGIGYSNLPVHGAADLTRENVITFDRMMQNSNRPVLVHCASGNRVGAMAALRAAWVEGKSEEDAIAIGKAWGLKSLEPQVRDRIRSEPASADGDAHR